MEPIVIYPARRVITMNPSTPEAEAVAVSEGRTVAVGPVAELASWGEHRIDDRFADKVLMPGMIEAHSHAGTGAAWNNTYVGFFDRKNPDGVKVDGCGDIDAVLDRLRNADAAMEADGLPNDEPLLAWSLDPLYFEGERLYGHHLDMVSTARPIYVQHASGHLATVNSRLMEVDSISADSPTPGVMLGPDGTPNGELHERAAMALAASAFTKLRSRISPDAIRNYARGARNTGATLVTDLATGPLDDETMETWRQVAGEADYPARVMLVGSPFGGGTDNSTIAARAVQLQAESIDKLRFGVIKLFLDGSIQGFTARVSWPYYYDPPKGNAENGLWLTAPDQMADIVEAYHRAGLTVHCHCNGDQATEAFIDAVEEVLERHPRWDHRHTVQHCQLTTKAQYRRMKALGMCANIFSNHMFYWGDQHRDRTMGPERARGMDACATALQEGVPFSIHSDSPVTPLGGLHVAWCAVNRQTATGRTLGTTEQISVADALHAITLGAAWQLKLDHEMGSIEAGKLADYAVLEDDPLSIEPSRLAEVGVWGTVLGGVPLPAGT